MRLREYFDTILASDPADWYRISGGDAPVFRQVVRPAHDAKGALDLDVHEIDTLYALRTDIDIAIGRGVTLHDGFHEPWTDTFADQSASSVWVHFFYRGAVVYTEVLVGVDGFRGYLPMPDPKLLTVPKGALDMARLLWEIGPSSWPFDEYVKQAGSSRWRAPGHGKRIEAADHATARSVAPPAVARYWPAYDRCAGASDRGVA